jgi:hypothetical protein
MEAVLIGTERIANMLLRCLAYEEYYINPVPTPLNHESLKNDLIQLYASVFAFLAKAKRFLDSHRIRKFRL